MRCPLEVDEGALRATIKAIASGPLVETPWPCDVMGINAEIIRLHNEDGLNRGVPVEEKYARIDASPKTLESLLWQDYAYLAERVPALRLAERRYVFTEIAAPHPDAISASLQTDSGIVHLICFKSPIIHLINSAFSKIFVLNHNFRSADALPEHEHLFDGDTYSDTRLLAGLFNDIEVLFDQKRLYLPFEPPHMAFPYDYCDQAEGARRFVLAHELGHTLYEERDCFPDIGDRTLTTALTAAGVKEWTEEFWCD